MKIIRSAFVILLFMGFLLSITSCLVVETRRTTTSQKKGWNKNPNNPHHPATTNPGRSKGKNKK